MPSSPVIDSRPSSRPIFRLLDLLGRRWSMRILWEVRDGPRTSRALREACGHASPGVMQSRLNELRAAGFIAKQPGGYGLTMSGQDLLTTFLPLYVFADRWAAATSAEDDGQADAG